ncbi:MAG: ribonuclease III [Desulfobacterota bacterium]|nr:ribonuclease III [Thermodesulfobacteriota bacterium]
MDEQRLKALSELEERLGYRFREKAWLDRALTHKSYVHQTVAPSRSSNEVLEYLGDAVLNLAVSHLLIEGFPEAHEGLLSMWRSHLVKRSSLAFFAKQLRLDHFLLVGKGEQRDGGANKASILANAFEALIGAVYLDSGYDQALRVVRNHFEPYLGMEGCLALSQDYKSLLQNFVQKEMGVIPRYRVLREAGPDHRREFQASVMIGEEIKGTGWGNSKKKAEQEAARFALGRLRIERMKTEG